MTGKTRKAADPASIAKAAELLRKGGVIIHPTETLYGFAASALIPNAIRRIDAIKERKFQDTYIVLMKDRAMVDAYHLIFDRQAEKLADHFWPGPLTLVLPVRRDSDLIHLASNGMLAVRVSPDPFVSALFTLIDFPVISTSVNKSGSAPLRDPVKMEALFRNSVERIFERGVSPEALPSTIVSSVNNVLTLLRKGAVPEEAIYGV